MVKHMAVLSVAGVAALGILVLSISGNPGPPSGSWQVDSRHSAAQIITDGTTDFGKKKIDITLGFGRLNGRLKLDDSDPTRSSVDFRIYPATSMAPPIAEDGAFKAQWLSNLANHTLVCFHSKKLVSMPDGRIQATGTLTLTRVDRNVEAAPSEAYSGPVYGPPMVHRVSQETTLLFEFSANEGKGQKLAGIDASTSKKIFREDFPQLVKAVVNTYWPTVVQDEECETPAPSEAYSGPMCTGTFLEIPSLPASPYARAGEDYPGPQDFNGVVGERLTILVHMHLVPQASDAQTTGGN